MCTFLSSRVSGRTSFFRGDKKSSENAFCVPFLGRWDLAVMRFCHAMHFTGLCIKLKKGIKWETSRKYCEFVIYLNCTVHIIFSSKFLQTKSVRVHTVSTVHRICEPFLNITLFYFMHWGMHSTDLQKRSEFIDLKRKSTFLRRSGLEKRLSGYVYPTA